MSTNVPAYQGSGVPLSQTQQLLNALTAPEVLGPAVAGAVLGRMLFGGAIGMVLGAIAAPYALPHLMRTARAGGAVVTVDQPQVGLEIGRRWLASRLGVPVDQVGTASYGDLGGDPETLYRSCDFSGGRAAIGYPPGTPSGVVAVFTVGGQQHTVAVDSAARVRCLDGQAL